MRRILFFIGAVFLLRHGFCAPSITSVSGTNGDGQTLTITGSDFGTQPHSKPTLYADFEGPSQNPDSTKGIASAWDDRDNMSTTTVSVFEGTYSLGSDSGWESTIARVRYDVTLATGSKSVVAWWRRATYVVADADNWKWIRLWSVFDVDNFPNFYNAQSPGNFNLVYTESCPVGSHRKTVTTYTEPNSTWIHDEWLFLMHTATGNYDGSWTITQTGSVSASSSTWDFNCDGQTGNLFEISLEDDPSSFTPSGNVYYDLIYIDTGTWSRVYLSTSTSVTSRRFLQPYSAWSDTQITITQEHGDMPAGTKYVFVCDNNNDCSSAASLLLPGKKKSSFKKRW